MDFRILGPLEVHEGGVPLDLGRPRQRAILAFLLVHHNEVVSADRLADELWDGEPVRDAAAILRPHVSRLRRILSTPGTEGAAVLQTRRPGYMLRVAPHDVDAHRFETGVGEGRAAAAEGRSVDAAEHLAAALDLWRGPALTDFSGAEFALAEAARLEELRLAAHEDLVEARLGCGEHRALVSELESLVLRHPLRERLWAHRILALYRCGRQADALRAFQECRTVLGEEVGIEPGPELRRLEESVLLQRPELDWSGPPVGRDHTTRWRAGGTPGRHRLPAHLTAFIGREAERARVAELLGTTRLITLTGAGGCGKTRLAFEVATGTGYPDGVWAIDLSPVSDPDLVDRVVAAGLGVRGQSGTPLVDTVAAEIGEAELLLLLDNCEQVLDASAHLAEALLHSCPGLRVLATSREPLGVPGELAWRVPSLSLPDLEGEPDVVTAAARSEAVQLFVDRARLVEADFELTAANAAAVAGVCRRLDGIALAIELAAARLAVLSVEEVASRLSDCFSVLTGGGRTLLPRQQTLEAAIEWSWDLLSGTERALLARLSVFAGGFTVDAVEAVCSGGEVPSESMLDLLSQLRRKSLLLRDVVSGASRYALLETIRQYGWRRLAEAGALDEARRRHAAWCIALATTAEADLTGPDQAAWMARLELEHDNMRAALEWAAAGGDPETGLALAGSLTLFWRVRGHFDQGREWLCRALSRASGAPPALRAKALWGQGFLSGMLGEYEEGISLVTESLALYRGAGDGQGCGRALLLLGNCQQFVEGPEVALPLLRESVDFARVAGDPWCLATGLAISGWVHMSKGELGVARPLLEECLSIAGPLNDKQSVAMGVYILGWTALLQGDFAAARRHLEEGLAVYRELGESYGIAVSLALLGKLAVAEGEYQVGRARLEQGLALARRVRSPGVVAYTSCELGRVAAGAGDLVAARARFEDALAATGASGPVFRPALVGLGYLLGLEGDRERSRAILDEALERARAGGDRLETALALHGLGLWEERFGHGAEARARYCEALQIQATVGSAPAVADSLDAVAAHLARTGQLIEAATLLGLVDRHRADLGYVRMPAARHKNQEAVDLIRFGLSPDDLDEAIARAGAMGLDEAVALALDSPQRAGR